MEHVHWRSELWTSYVHFGKLSICQSWPQATREVTADTGLYQKLTLAHGYLNKRGYCHNGKRAVKPALHWNSVYAPSGAVQDVTCTHLDPTAVVMMSYVS